MKNRLHWAIMSHYEQCFQEEEMVLMAEITESKNFIHAFIDEDIAEGGRYAGQTVHTRFPPEPNGYLHLSLIHI